MQELLGIIIINITYEMYIYTSNNFSEIVRCDNNIRRKV